MKQNYYFLVGLPRTGNTLLSSILNQNSNIKVTPYSVVPEILHNINNIKQSIGFQVFPLEKNVNDVLRNVFKNYYKSWKSNFIIDRGPWATKVNLQILKSIFKKNIKMIVLKRSFFEVLASYVKVTRPDNIEKYIDELLNDDFSMISMNLYPYLNLKKQNDIKYIVINYDDLVYDTENQIKKIYSFLEMPYFKHFYTNLNQLNIDNISYRDYLYKGDVNFHTIRTDKIKKNNYNFEDILPSSIIKKYSDLNNIINNFS